MKILLATILLSLVALLGFQCVPSPTVPDAGGAADAGCDDATPLEAKKCPPCNCAADAGRDANPSPAPVGDLADQACKNIAQWCSEGRAANCASELRALAPSRLVTLDLKACAAAKSAADVRRCGPFHCNP